MAAHDFLQSREAVLLPLGIGGFRDPVGVDDEGIAGPELELLRGVGRHRQQAQREAGGLELQALAVRADEEEIGDIGARHQQHHADRTHQHPERSSDVADDILFQETQRLSEKLAGESGEDTHVEEEPGREIVKEKFMPLYKRIAKMTLSQKVRRVTFYTEPGRDGMAELKMTLAPILVDTNSTFLPYTVTLATDVTRFGCLTP